MADNVAVTAGSGTTVAADEVVDGTLGTVKVQYVKLMDGTLDGTTKAAVGARGLAVDIAAAAASIAKAEDAAHASGDTGVAILGVRRDTAASGAGTDGDYATLNLDATGHLYVAIKDSQLDGSEYETVAASQTAQTLGATGGTGDYISKVVIIPATTSPGNVLLLDNATSITIFAGGASSVATLHPFTVDLGMFSVSGAWKITTGSNVSAIGIGNFA
jgi:hypothetical protein